jgi:hypothetical protein
MARFLREARGYAKAQSRANRYEMITRSKSSFSGIAIAYTNNRQAARKRQRGSRRL